jgi:hypothetical protein
LALGVWSETPNDAHSLDQNNQLAPSGGTLGLRIKRVALGSIVTVSLACYGGQNGPHVCPAAHQESTSLATQGIGDRIRDLDGKRWHLAPRRFVYYECAEEMAGRKSDFSRSG